MSDQPACPACYGTGTFPGPYDPREGQVAHHYEVVCGCGGLMRNPVFAGHGYQGGELLPFSHHRLVIVRAAGKAAWIDQAIAADVERLWLAGIGTLSSCQGGIEYSYSRPFIMVRRAQDAEHAMSLVPWATEIKHRTDSSAIYGAQRDGST